MCLCQTETENARKWEWKREREYKKVWVCVRERKIICRQLRHKKHHEKKKKLVLAVVVEVDVAVVAVGVDVAVVAQLGLLSLQRLNVDCLFQTMTEEKNSQSSSPDFKS